MSFLTSLLGGGFLGVFGSIGSGVLNFFKQKQDHAHELAVLKQQTETAIAVGGNQITLEAYKAFQSSYESDKATYANAGIVDTIRGLVRPVVTIYLVLVASVLAGWSFSKVGIGSILTESVVEHAVKAIYDFTGMALGFYFGSRSLEKFSKIKK